MTDKYEHTDSPITLLLSYVGRQVRLDAYQYWNEHEYATRECICMGEEWCSLWFRTGGCMLERAGSCIVCKYGTGPIRTAEEIVMSLKQGVESITKDYDFLLVSSSGSTWDSNEVPETAFNEYLDILAVTNHRTFGLETRCEAVSTEVVRRCQYKLGGRLQQVFMGLEVANEAVLKCCLNKTQRLSDFVKAINTLAKEGVDACVNVLVGIPFLGVMERIELAVQSISWAFDKGAYRVFLFPINVKQNTPLAILYTEGMYDPPSLWELVEVLSRFPKEICEKKLGVSWYHPGEDVPGIIHSPLTCQACLPEVLQILDKYDRKPQFSFVKDLLNYPCICRSQWQRDISSFDVFSVSRTMEYYTVLAKEWDEARRIYFSNRNVIKSELEVLYKNLQRIFN